MSLTHLSTMGEARMVDVGAKADTHRIAEARGFVSLNGDAYNAIVHGNLAKGDALSVARIAGILAAKRTSDLIPLCHPVSLTKVEVHCEPENGQICIRSHVECMGKTGVEMEALTAVSVAALTIYDMAKAVDRSMIIHEIHLTYKTGGKSGDYNSD